MVRSSERIYSINNIDANTREELCINGMLHSVRDMGGFAFLILRLSDGLLQCVYDKQPDEPLPVVESALLVLGKPRAEPRATGGVEVRVRMLEVLTQPKYQLPVNVSKRDINISMESELALRPATLRHERRRDVFRLQQRFIKACRDYLAQNGFTEIISPKLVSGGAEGGSNMFEMKYFGQRAYLAQSPQFYKQTMVPVYQRVFEIGPVFRAEKHNTPRHLNEYVSLDIEMGFIDGFEDVMDMQQRMLSAAFACLYQSCPGLLERLGVHLPDAGDIPRLRFCEAKELIAARFNRKIRDPYDLQPEEERLLGQLAEQDYGSQLIFITHYPEKKRPFYAMDDPDDPRYTLSFDLLYKGMEVTTGGQRIHDYDMQVKKMQSRGMDAGEYESYLMLHKYGCPPHGGLGMGVERFTMQLLGERNIRAASMFPRDTNRLAP